MYRILFLAILGLTLAGCSTAKKSAGPGSDRSSPGSTQFVPYDTPAEMSYFHAAEYPRWAKNMEVRGEVWVEVLIDTTGKVSQVELLKATISQRLVGNVRRSARHCKYKPAMRNGRPVAMTFRYKVLFRPERPYISWVPLSKEEARTGKE